MKTPTLLLSLAFVVPAALLTTEAQAGGKCGLKSECHCRVTAGDHKTTTSRDNLIEINAKGTHLFTYTIPNKCFNRVWDAYVWRLNKGCWKACRDAAGVEGATPDPGFRAQVAAAGARLKAMGACGGWYGGVFQFAAGKNKFRNATAAELGIGGLGSVRIENGKKVCR